MLPTQDKKPMLPPFNEVIELPQQFMRNKEWLEAAKCWSIIRYIYPEQPAPWLQGAYAHIEAGELDHAETLLAHARQYFPDHPSTLLESAALAMCRQDWDTAETFLQQARENYPDNLQSWVKSAKCAEGRGDLEQASVYYQKSCQCAPDRPDLFIRHAELTMRSEQWEQALERWETVRDHFPDVATGYLRAAEAARQLNRPKEARQLVLAHQYGNDIFNDDVCTQQTQKQHSHHERLNRLLELIWTKSIFNLRSEVHHNYLSYGWWVLEPLLHMVIYYLVFGILLQRGGENYSVFLLTGLIPWMWFMKAISGSSNSIIAGKNLMLQVGLPSIVFPLVSLLQASLKQIPVFILLFAFLWLQGFTPGAHWWALIPLVVVQALLITAFACTVAAVIPFVRDLSYLVPTGLTFLMFLSGIFYDYKIIAEQWQSLFLLNPMAFLLKCYREIFIDGVLPDMQTLAWWGLGGTIACLVMIVAYKRLRYIYPRIVME